jgi:hypothetical protein|tara:strand:+ start:364 stop:660 length:297 start_codon:yes stop_codon:yes gene_type:complete
MAAVYRTMRYQRITAVVPQCQGATAENPPDISQLQLHTVTNALEQLRDRRGFGKYEPLYREQPVLDIYQPYRRVAGYLGDHEPCPLVCQVKIVAASCT